jgi:hypothetical protein
LNAEPRLIHDIVPAADALAPLGAVPDDDPRWEAVAAPTDWAATRCVEHIGDALLFYAGQVIRRAGDRRPVLRDGRAGRPSEHLELAGTAARLLAVTLADLGDGRAWHPSGLADATGWAGMAITELLVHGTDVASALGAALPLPEDVCRRTVARVFPWVSEASGPMADVLLAVTGRSRAPHDPDWWWQSAPLSEWDGRPRRRTVPPGWT